MKTKLLLFWQPKKNILDFFLVNSIRETLLIFINYSIWIFFFFVCFILIKNNINVFWQLLIATIIAEGIERFLKSKIYWRRPLFKRTNKTPPGLVDKWYKTGSFPSGHTIKSVFIFLFILQYQVFSLPLFLLFVIPLLIFRVIAGFHYPIDILGGVVIGFIVWITTFWITFPQFLNDFVQTIFNLVFFIK